MHGAKEALRRRTKLLEIAYRFVAEGTDYTHEQIAEMVNEACKYNSDLRNDIVAVVQVMVEQGHNAHTDDLARRRLKKAAGELHRLIEDALN